jgi:uncharacterized protein (TIGR02996 family)
MTAEDWWALVAQNPEDTETRLAFAAWLIDEANDPTGAEAVQGMLRNDKRPLVN